MKLPWLVRGVSIEVDETRGYMTWNPTYSEKLVIVEYIWCIFRLMIHTLGETDGCRLRRWISMALGLHQNVNMTVSLDTFCGFHWVFSPRCSHMFSMMFSLKPSFIPRLPPIYTVFSIVHHWNPGKSPLLSLPSPLNPIKPPFSYGFPWFSPWFPVSATPLTTVASKVRVETCAMSSKAMGHGAYGAAKACRSLDFFAEWVSYWWFQPLWKNISQLGWLFSTYGKIKHVPNHQPVFVYIYIYIYTYTIYIYMFIYLLGIIIYL